MVWNKIEPFARFPRELVIKERSSSGEVFPVDARFFYTEQGCGQIRVDGKIVCMPRGSAILINSGVIYRIIPSDVKYLAMNFDWTLNFCQNSIPIAPIPCCNGKSGTELRAFENVSFEDCRELDRYAYCENAFFAEKTMLEMIERYEKKQLFYQLENDAQLVLLLTEFVRHLTARKTNRFDIDAVVDYLQRHYSENITNKSIAEIFYFHPNYISSEFRRTFGKPLHRYLLELRVTKAIGLLETGRYSVQDAAYAVGFEDANYFARYFRKITGKAPKRMNS